MNKNNLIVFENGTPIRLKPCGCDQGKVKKREVTFDDIYSVEELARMGENPNKVLEEYYMCANCESKLERI